MAAGLSAVVLAGLWTLFSIFERLFTKAETQVQRAQLARALVQQLTDDLHSAIPDNASVEASGAASVRRFGLFGTRDALQVDVLQVTAEQVVSRDGRPVGPSLASSPTDEAGDLFFHDTRPQAPELHTVRYTFERPDEWGEGDPAALSGLVRREFGWETPAEEGEDWGHSAARDERSEADAEEFDFLAEEFAADDPLSIVAHESSATWAPEVVGVEFRYFDGSGWVDEWNSLERKSLPVAVEAVLQVRSSEPSESPRPPAPPPMVESSEEPFEEAVEEAINEGPRIKVLTQRVLIHLPSTALAHGPKKTEIGPQPVVAPLAAPLAAPAYLDPAPLIEPPRRNLPLPDQWMRSGS